MVVAAVMTVKAQEERTITVGELFDLVESNSKTLQLQKTSVEFAQQGIDVAKNKRLPEVSTDVSVSFNGNVLTSERNFTDVHGYSVPHLGNSFALEARQVVYAGGAIDAGIRLAELEHSLARVGESLTREQQRFMALGQYLDLYKLRNSEQVYAQNISLTERLIADIKEKYEQGLVLRNDVTRYELQLETLKLGLRKVQDRRAIINHELCNTLGLTGVSVSPDTTMLSLAIVASTEQHWQQQAIVAAPELERSRLQHACAEQLLRLARSEQLPKVALVAADYMNGPFNYDLPPKDINYNYWYVGVGVHYPISALYTGKKRVRQALTAVRQSHEAAAVAAEQVNNRVQRGYTLLQQAMAELDTRRKSVELAQQNYQVVSDRYRSQLALITDMLDASSMKLDAELQLVDARISIIYAYYQMKYLTGTL